MKFKVISTPKIVKIFFYKLHPISQKKKRYNVNIGCSKTYNLLQLKLLQGCVDMNAYDAWKNFLETGSVVDYLRYTSLRDSQENFPEYFSDEDDFDMQEGDDEDIHGRIDYRGAKYW
ncbi:MAG: hypothetical protein U0L18_10850 [Acutalibacteraceae bacterium]|nr:hypothetical protein [Acutalibacteraceae bacterium]